MNRVWSTMSVLALLGVFVAAGMTVFAFLVCADPPPKPNVTRGTPAGRTGPNLMADSSFESTDTPFTLDTPFRVVADAHAHSGKADVQATLSHSGKRMVARL